jgi:methylated-DNA-[protein]-cysteine S-methyltransferase
VIPCHRVLAAHGRIGGYSGGGPEIKRRLLHLEGVHLPSAR